MKNNENIIIDIGSNTLKISVFNQNQEKIYSYNAVISLALDMQNGLISNQAVQRLCKALDLFAKKYPLSGAKCVATAVFRQSKNSKQITDMLFEKYGFYTHVISSKLEANLVKIAISNHNIQNALIVDIGGASTELICGDESVSFDFGILSFYKAVKSSSKKLNKTEQKQLKTTIKKQIIPNDKLALNIARQITAKARNYIQKCNFKKIVLCSKVCIYAKSIQNYTPYKNVKEKEFILKNINKKTLLNSARKLGRMHEKRARFYVGDNRKEFLIYGVLLLVSMFDKNDDFICFDDALVYGLLHYEFDN